LRVLKIDLNLIAAGLTSPEFTVSVVTKDRDRECNWDLDRDRERDRGDNNIWIV